MPTCRKQTVRTSLEACVWVETEIDSEHKPRESREYG